MINAASDYLVAGAIPEPQGNAHSSIVPYQAFRASNGYVMIGAANDKLFHQLCQALGHPEWAIDERYRTNGSRVQHREPLVAQIEALVQTETVQMWEHRLAAAGVAVAPVNRMDQVFQDPQVLFSQQVVTIAHPSVGDVKMVGPAVTYSLTPALVTTPPPRLGEQTEEVRRALMDGNKREARGT